MDKLTDMFEREVILARNWIPIDEIHACEKSSAERQKYLATYIQLLGEEATEFLRCLPARKFWRESIRYQPVNESAIREELSDLWHILIAITYLSGVNAEEIYNLFVVKNNINLQRLQNNS